MPLEVESRSKTRARATHKSKTLNQTKHFHYLHFISKSQT